ncbi:unnamed protein product [Rotaria sp. Silwood1]|nr:unnamed protein product [Rotaria sp. Silwood1]CAF1630465.1 unnamed protein product [Rotaria sp. Silwood1]CAF3781676.1 unnamed protein product [Rotaria sp. Silwood1]CAF3820799.1 unnamed protein product [Rotaria sp. Silwood1]CAF3830560.1 unnamed protein product [Rotaria sp. Silwood1]
MFSLFSSVRSIADITIQELAPLRIRVKVQLEIPNSDKKDYFYVDGHVCQNGFQRDAAIAVCRSLGQGANPIFALNRPIGNGPFKECFFQYGDDKIVIPCTFLMEQFKCNESATSLGKCQHSKLFDQQCAGDMYVAILC